LLAEVEVEVEVEDVEAAEEGGRLAAEAGGRFRAEEDARLARRRRGRLAAAIGLGDLGTAEIGTATAIGPAIGTAAGMAEVGMAEAIGAGMEAHGFGASRR
jgi:hypothetical protein